MVDESTGTVKNALLDQANLVKKKLGRRIDRMNHPMHTIWYYSTLTGGHSERDVALKVNKIADWCGLPVPERQQKLYILNSLKGLRQCAKTRKIPGYTTRKTKESLIQLLVEHDSGGTTVAGGVTTNRSPEEQVKFDLLCAIIKCSFLPKLTGARREHCTAGHKNETPLVKQLVADSESTDVDTCFKVEAVCQPGLVGKAEKLYAKDSIDFLAFATPPAVEGEQEPTASLVGIEVKTRATPGTAQDELDRATAPSGDRQAYEVVDAGDVNFTRRFRDQHEAVQVLHHAYCYDLEHVLLLAGDRGANVISGTWVRFNSDLKEIYGNILDTVYGLCLIWAYDESGALPDELLDEVLTAAASKTRVTREEFEMNLKVWRETSNSSHHSQGVC